jgi:hypothetical protein
MGVMPPSLELLEPDDVPLDDEGDVIAEEELLGVSELELDTMGSPVTTKFRSVLS